MTDSQRNCFMAVAEHSSFSKAAEALYVSQPAVSKNISTLEAELEVSLFDRQGKYVLLTKAGEILLSFLTEYNREYDAMIKRIRSLGHSTPYGTIRIGCGITWNGAHFYTRLVRHFAIHFPGIHLEVEGMDPEGFFPALRRKEVDIVIMYDHDTEKPHEIESCHLLNLGTGFLCSSALKDVGNSVSDLAGHPFLIVETPTDRRNGSTYRQVVTSILEKQAITPEFTVCRSMSAGLVDVSCRKGALFVDDWTSAVSNSEFKYIPSGESSPICLAWVKNSTDPLLKLVIDETKKVFGGNY